MPLKATSDDAGVVLLLPDNYVRSMQSKSGGWVLGGAPCRHLPYNCSLILAMCSVNISPGALLLGQFGAGLGHMEKLWVAKLDTKGTFWMLGQKNRVSAETRAIPAFRYYIP